MNLVVKIFISLIYQIHKYYLSTWEDLLEIFSSKDIYKFNLSDSQVLFKYLRRSIGVLNKKTKRIKYVNAV